MIQRIAIAVCSIAAVLCVLVCSSEIGGGYLWQAGLVVSGIMATLVVDLIRCE